MLETVRKEVMQERAFEKEMRKFGELVIDDPGIQEQLRAINDRDVFISTYVRLAAEKGFRFTEEQMRVAVQEQKQGSDWILPRVVQSMLRLL